MNSTIGRWPSHSGPRGGKSQKFDVLKSAYTKVSLKVDKISDTMQKKSAQ